MGKADNLTREQSEELGVKTEEMDTELWLNYMLDSKLDSIRLNQLKEHNAKDT